MFARSAFLATAFSLANCLFSVAAPTPPPGAATDAETTPEVVNSKFQFAGAIKGTGVPILSGPGEKYYPAIKLDDGSPVTVVGIKTVVDVAGKRSDWLKIMPPPGSFSAVAKGFIQKMEGSNVGKVTSDNLNVRAGSNVVNLKLTVQCKLKENDEVEILGEQDGYYKIKPPPGAYLYVNKEYVRPIKQLSEPVSLVPGPTTKPTRAVEPKPEGTVEKPAPKPEENTTETPTPPVVAAKPTTQSIEGPRAEAEFDRLEKLYEANRAKPLIEQPTAELLAAYEKLSKNEYLPIPMRRTAVLRAVSYGVKNTAREELVATHKQQAEANARLDKIRADRAEIDQRLQSGVAVYAAVGTLQASTVQAGEGTIYRLTDPTTSRTLCYVRGSDPKFVTFIDKFVGVKGDLGSDPQLTLRVVNAEEITTIDPARVNKGISAQVVPPSFLAPSPKPRPVPAGIT